MSAIPGIDPSVPPSGTGCVECLETDDQWWFHLRRCAQCGHVGCCDSSPNQHAAPDSHPLDQPVPGPAGRVPSNWQELLNQ